MNWKLEGRKAGGTGTLVFKVVETKENERA
jgi:hypothetical protein